MKLFKSRLHLAVFGLITLPLWGCDGFLQRQDIGSLRESVVKITYGDKSGHTTGFLIEDNEAACTVLTVAHGIPKNTEILVTIDDSELFKASQVKRATDTDLATIVFNVEGSNNCPYPALRLGNSTKAKIDDSVRMVGYPERAGAQQIVSQFSKGYITNIQKPPLPDGYGISYDMTTVGGMSGAPVFNSAGKVIAVHGLTDVELVSLGRQQQSSLSTQQLAEINEAEKRLTRINHFKWGIPIETFQKQRYGLVSDNGSISDSETKNSSKIESLLSRVLVYVTIFIMVIYILTQMRVKWKNGIDSKDAFAWYNRGVSLNNLGRDREAIDFYDKALEINPKDVSAWNNQGASLNNLRRDREAIYSYDKALEIDPQYAFAWNGRGNSLYELGSYQEAIYSYDKALEINPQYAFAWNGRGNSLDELGSYQEAIDSYDKALEIDPKYASAWNNRGVSLEKLGRDREALESYNKAIEIDPNYQTAVNNRNNLQDKRRQ